MKSGPEDLRSPALVRFFGGVMARQMGRSFHAVRVLGPGIPELPPGIPVMVCCNHPSWWDPAFIIVLATRGFPDRTGFGPIDAEALRRYPFMRRLGLFPVDRERRDGAVSFLRTGRSLLSRPDTMLWITAQGRFADQRQRPLRLRPGIAHLAAHMRDALILPLALEYPFWDERTPEALAAFGAPIRTADHPGLRPEAWRALLEDRLTATMDRLAHAAQTRDPQPFIPLIEGRVGVGGIYGLWRRLKAWSRGHSFDPAHGAVRGRGP